jgi:hypothetical protein
LYAVVVFLGSHSAGRPAGLVYQLPPDGAWVRFDLRHRGTLKVEFPPDAKAPEALKNAPPLPYEGSGSLTLSSVGRAEVNGETHRWLELKVDVEVSGRLPTPQKPEGADHKEQRHIVLKLLVPERRLAAGEDPLAHVRRLYFKDGERQPELVEDDKAKQYEIDRFRPLFPEPAAKAATSPGQVLSTRHKELGRLTCDKLAFQSDYAGPLARGRRGWWSWSGEHEVWLSEKTPFGVAALKLTGASDEWSKAKGEGVKATVVGTQCLVLSESGKGAVSALPDCK